MTDQEETKTKSEVEEIIQEETITVDEDTADELAAEEEGGSEEVSASEAKTAERKKRSAAKRAPKKQSILNPDLEERVVAVNRVAKVVKGGRRFSFSVLMVVGDKKGHVGYGLGKAREVPEAIKKATMNAQKHMITVPITRGTLPHAVLGEFDAGKILFKPALFCSSFTDT